MDDDEIGWFDIDPDHTPSEVQIVFVEALRRRAESWASKIGPGHTLVSPVDFDQPDLIVATLDIGDDGRNRGLLDAGVHFDGFTIRCDEVHNQLFTLPDTPTPLSRVASGAPEELAERAADWFEWVWDRPVELHQWLHQGDVYATAYLITDPKMYLSYSYRDDQAPPGQRDRLIAEGHVHGLGWIQPPGIGTPDQIIHVRGHVGRG